MSRLLKKINKDNENSARKGLLQDLFNDFHKNRHQIYWMNFVRGIFFGVGSVLGGTIVIALLIWLLSRLVDLPGGVGNFIQFVVNTVQKH